MPKVRIRKGFTYSPAPKETKDGKLPEGRDIIKGGEEVEVSEATLRNQSDIFEALDAHVTVGGLLPTDAGVAAAAVSTKSPEQVQKDNAALELEGKLATAVALAEDAERRAVAAAADADAARAELAAVQGETGEDVDLSSVKTDNKATGANP